VATAYVALGANLGDRLATLREAVRRIAALGRVDAVSSVYETDPVGYEAQPPFLNAVLRLDTPHPPAALLASLLAIETALGRVRSFPNAPRLLDLDLLVYDDLVRTAPELALPHPRLHERAFVLAPLAEVAPDLVHPALNRTMSELFAGVDDRAGVRRIADPLT
jgi:2-amino-4-hydroxy-6-hydroxymethyldihydropteridine diphosphokinase